MEKRKRLGLSQSQMGEFLEVSHAAVSDIERGVTNLNVEEISKIASILKTTFEELTYTNDFGLLNQQFFSPQTSGLSSFRLDKQVNSSDIQKAQQTINERLEQLRKEKK